MTIRLYRVDVTGRTPRAGTYHVKAELPHTAVYRALQPGYASFDDNDRTARGNLPMQDTRMKPGQAIYIKVRLLPLAARRGRGSR